MGKTLTLGALLALVAQTACAEDLWAVYEPACNANGIGERQCRCIIDVVVERQGEAAARYVALDMSLRYDEAAAALEEVGEDKAFAAAETFDIAMNKDCSAARLARMAGADTAVTTGAAVATEAAAIGRAPEPDKPPSTGGPVFEQYGDVPIIDLRNRPNGLVIDVSDDLSDAALSSQGQGNIRDFLGFHVVNDESGRIHTTAPGDDGYGNAAQTRGVPTKLYFEKTGVNTQYLGNVRLPGGAIYVPYLRYRGDGSAAQAPIHPENVQSMRDIVMRGMTNNANLYFVFAGANADGEPHLRRLSATSFGFGATAGGDLSDIVFTVSTVGSHTR